MKRVKEDNTTGIIQRAVMYLGIHVVKSSVKEALKSHPDYPTFKSICDTLKEWHIENYPLRYEIDELPDIEAPYIVHFKNGGGQLGFVTNIENGHVTYYSSYKEKRKIDKKEFLENCSGAIILLNSDERSGEKNFPSKWKNELINKSILPLALTSILFLSIHLFANHFISEKGIIDKVIPVLLFTKIAGIIISILLILHEFEVHLSFIDKLCHFNKATNCDTALNDKASKVFGWFGWADIGFIYFTSGFLFLLLDLRGSGLPLLAILASLSIPYSFFSIYYQGFVLNKWCPMCLGVQVILFVEFILLLPQFLKFSLPLSSFVSLALTFLIITTVYTLFILLRREKISDEMYYFKYLGFKKNPDILKVLLLNQPHYDIPFSESNLILGNRNASLKITAFLSLHCSHCARALEKISNILKEEEDILINLVLITSDNKMLTILHNYIRECKDDESMKLLKQWFNADPYSRTRITEGLCIPEDNDISYKVNEENGVFLKSVMFWGLRPFF